MDRIRQEKKMNERAQAHWDNANEFATHANQALNDGKINEAITCTGLAELSLKLAQFAYDHHALVAGIDEDKPINPANPVGAGGAPVWGAMPPPPLPAHIAAQVRPGEIG
jgi:hypothetical protein